MLAQYIFIKKNVGVEFSFKVSGVTKKSYVSITKAATIIEKVDRSPTKEMNLKLVNPTISDLARNKPIPA